MAPGQWWRDNVIKPIHNARFPLPRLFGVHASVYMQFVYPFPVLVGGYVVMNWAIEQSVKNIGEKGEKLRGRRDLHRGNTTSQNDDLARALKDAAAGKQ